MRMTHAEPFSTAAITASLAKLRIDQSTIERSIKRTVADIMARQLLAAKRHDATLLLINAEARAEYQVEVAKPSKPPRTRKAAAAISAKFPGEAPEVWQDLDAMQLRWFRTYHPGSLELRLAKIDRGQQPINSPAYVVQLLAKFKKRKALVARDCRPDPERDGLAYVLPRGKGWEWVADNAACTHGELASRRAAKPQHVIETDPILFDIPKREEAKFREQQAWQDRKAHFAPSAN